MKIRICVGTVLTVFLLQLTVACGSPVTDFHRVQPDKQTKSELIQRNSSNGIDSIADSFQNEMETADYEVRQGYIQLFTLDNCEQAVETFGNCFGANPAAPYIIPAYEYADDEFIDPYYGGKLQAPGTEYNGAWRLRPGEANVIIGITPPNGAYFGYQTYVFTREGETNTPFKEWLLGIYDPSLTDLLFGQSPNPDRINMFASLGDSINNQVIAQATGTSGFGELVAFISTPDRDLAAEIKDRLIAAGIHSSAVFTEELPDIARYGYGESADDFVTLMRYALPESETAGDAYKADIPLLALRVTPNSQQNVNQFGTKNYESRGGSSEKSYKSAKKSLVNRVKLAFGTLALSRDFIKASIVGLKGHDCIATGMNCLGETRDTDTYGISPTYEFNGNNEVIAVVGVDHTQTGNASYISLGVNNKEELKGVAAVSQTGSGAGFIAGELRGSAQRFLDHYGLRLPFWNRSKTRYLYVRLFSRDCSGLPECTEISEDEVYGIPEGKEFLVMHRAYMRPGTLRGPDPTKLQNPVAFKFNR